MFRTCFAVVAIVGATVAFAQSEHTYDGKWKITFDGTRTVDMEGTVVIKGNAGTWDMATRAVNNPCVGRQYPITVQKATADELFFTVNRAATLVGCKDGTYSFRKVDDKTLKGEVGGGRPASLVRD